jgi:tetratricopeptide (TPR) repeat protein
MQINSRGKFTDQALRFTMVAGGIALMFWAATNMGGCHSSGRSKGIAEAKNAAQARIDTLKAANEYQMAVQALTAGDLDKAQKHGDRALTLNASVPRSWVLRGRIMMEQGNMQAAHDSLLRAEQLSPTDVEAQYYLGILAERVARREEAKERYLKAAELDGENPQYPLAAAEMMIDLGNIDEAESFLKNRQSQFQHAAGIQQLLGQIAMLRNDYKTAAIAFNEARLLAPNENEIVEDLARTLFLDGQYAEADMHLAKLLKDETFGKRRDLAHMRAKCLISLDRNTEARDLLVQLTRQEGGNSDREAWIQLGQVAYQLRDSSRVRMAFSRLIAMSPERPEGYVLKALHLRRNNDLKGSEENFRLAVDREQDPKINAENMMMLGLVMHAQNKTRSAQTIFAKAAELDPSNQMASKLAKEPALASVLANANDE